MANQSELIKQLRSMTQAGFMDCKKALDNSNNDLDAAVKWLRENGIAKAAKKVDSIASEGIIALKAEGNQAVMMEINSQTDFVSKNEMFLQFVSDLSSSLVKSELTDVNQVEEMKLASGKTVNEMEIELTATIGEKISLRRLVNITANDNQSVGTYLHANKRIGVILLLSKQDDQDFVKHLAMHIAASNPKFISKASVDQNWLNSERQVIQAQIETDDQVKAKLEKAPADKQKDLLDKILEGRINKLLVESCLESQPYLIDNSMTVGDLLKKHNVQVEQMIRFEVGEGIEKKVDNFADEVKAQMQK